MNDRPSIVLIHGLWLNALSWEHWVERYRARGFDVVAKSWPGLDKDVGELVRDPAGMEHLGLVEIVDHYEKIIRALPRPPIIVGHSFGGVITQILLDHGLGAAGVAIDSGPVKGMLKLPWSQLRSGFPALKSPGNVHKAVTLTPEEFHYAFTSTLTDAESKKVFDRYAVPGPGRVLFQGAFANFTPHAANTVDFHNDERAPLLLVAGSVDHVAPAVTNRENLKLQSKSKAITAYKEFEGRSHWTIGQPGWESVADFVLDWALAPKPLP